MQTRKLGRRAGLTLALCGATLGGALPGGIANAFAACPGKASTALSTGKMIASVDPSSAPDDQQIYSMNLDGTSKAQHHDSGIHRSTPGARASRPDRKSFLAYTGRAGLPGRGRALERRRRRQQPHAHRPARLPVRRTWTRHANAEWSPDGNYVVMEVATTTNAAEQVYIARPLQRHRRPSQDLDAGLHGPTADRAPHAELQPRPGLDPLQPLPEHVAVPRHGPRDLPHVDVRRHAHGYAPDQRRRLAAPGPVADRVARQPVDADRVHAHRRLQGADLQDERQRHRPHGRRQRQRHQPHAELGPQRLEALLRAHRQRHAVAAAPRPARRRDPSRDPASARNCGEEFTNLSQNSPLGRHVGDAPARRCRSTRMVVSVTRTDGPTSARTHGQRDLFDEDRRHGTDAPHRRQRDQRRQLVATPLAQPPEDPLLQGRRRELQGRVALGHELGRHRADADHPRHGPAASRAERGIRRPAAPGTRKGTPSGRPTATTSSCSPAPRATRRNAPVWVTSKHRHVADRSASAERVDAAIDPSWSTNQQPRSSTRAVRTACPTRAAATDFEIFKQSVFGDVFGDPRTDQ